MKHRRGGRTLSWDGPPGTWHCILFFLLLFTPHVLSYSADPLSNISGMLMFDNREEAVAFAVKNGQWLNMQQ